VRSSHNDLCSQFPCCLAAERGTPQLSEPPVLAAMACVFLAKLCSNSFLFLFAPAQ